MLLQRWEETVMMFFMGVILFVISIMALVHASAGCVENIFNGTAIAALKQFFIAIGFALLVVVATAMIQGGLPG